MSRRGNHDAACEARVALEAVKEGRAVSELAAEHGVHPTMINRWNRSLPEGAAGIFERGGKAALVAEVGEERQASRAGSPSTTSCTSHGPWRTAARRGPLRQHQNRSAGSGTSLNHLRNCPRIGE